MSRPRRKTADVQPADAHQENKATWKKKTRGLAYLPWTRQLCRESMGHLS